MGGRGSAGGSPFSSKAIKGRLPNPGKTVVLQKLEGTEKQVKWARSIRKQLVTSLYNYAISRDSNGRPLSKEMQQAFLKGKDEMAASIKANSLVSDSTYSTSVRTEHLDSAVSSFQDVSKRFDRVSKIAANKSASYWIDNRGFHAIDRLKAYIDGK